MLTHVCGVFAVATKGSDAPLSSASSGVACSLAGAAIQAGLAPVRSTAGRPPRARRRRCVGRWQRLGQSGRQGERSHLHPFDGGPGEPSIASYLSPWQARDL